MQLKKEIHKKAHYRMVKTSEMISNRVVAMYGFEGFSGSKVISIVALSTDKKRVSSLVDALNRSGMELSQLQNIVDEFFAK